MINNKPDTPYGLMYYCLEFSLIISQSSHATVQAAVQFVAVALKAMAMATVKRRNKPLGKKGMPLQVHFTNHDKEISTCLIET